jgi:hypothetical protein
VFPTTNILLILLLLQSRFPDTDTDPPEILVIPKLGIVATVIKAVADVIPVVRFSVSPVAFVKSKFGIVAVLVFNPEFNVRVLVVMFVENKLGIVAEVSRAVADVIPVVRLSVDPVTLV